MISDVADDGISIVYDDDDQHGMISLMLIYPWCDVSDDDISKV